MQILNLSATIFRDQNVSLPKAPATSGLADARGGVVKITPDGRQDIITQHFGETFSQAQNAATQFTEGTLPNGLAFAKNGNIYISNFGTDVLEVMEPNGKTTVLYDEIDGEPIGKVNFVLRDKKERLWLTVSTRIKNWMEAISPNVSDGFIAMADDRGLRIMTDGLSFTNEIRFDANEEYLYIVETCGQRISRMKVAEDGTLSQREVFGPTQLGSGGFPDGIAFDSHGNLWAHWLCRIRSSPSRQRGLPVIWTTGSQKQSKHWKRPSGPTRSRQTTCWRLAARSLIGSPV